MKVGDQGRNGTAVTVSAVAAEAGVSVATAARALGQYGSVSPATRQRVLATASRLGYRANSLARSMITRSTRTLGVVVADIENPFFSQALRGISDFAHQHHYEVLLVNTDEDVESERAAVRVLVERRVDGLIVSPGQGDSAPHLQRVIDAGIPVVLLDRKIPGLVADSVGVANRAAARDATERLLALGHRRIALVTGLGPYPKGLPTADPQLRGIERAIGITAGLRAAGYRDALVAAGLTPDLGYLSAEGFRLADAAVGTRKLLAMPDPPTAIIALDSVLALGVLQALDDLGVRSPDEMSVIGFDDADWAEAVSPPLTVVSQPVHEIGRRAAELLISRLNGNDRPPVDRRLRTTFVERASTGPPRG